MRALKKYGVLFVVLIFVGLSLFVGYYWSDKPRFDDGVAVPFVYTMGSVIQDVDGRSMQGRTFVLGDGTTFSWPEKGTRGENILIPDPAMRVNTFRTEWKEHPRLKVGKTLIEVSGAYRILFFNVSQMEPQKVVPKLKPKS